MVYCPRIGIMFRICDECIKDRENISIFEYLSLMHQLQNLHLSNKYLENISKRINL